MNLVPASASRAASKAVFKSKKNSPHIFFGVGILTALGSVYLACKATLDLEETLDEVREDVVEANNRKVERIKAEDIIDVTALEAAEAERVKEVSVVTFKGVVAVGKLYLPAAILGTISVACLTGSHVQLTRRNAASMAAFSALTKAFDDYRERVKAEVGEEKEQEIYRSASTVEVLDEDGKKQLVQVVNPDGRSIYSKLFDEMNTHCWRNNAEMNRNFIETQEKYANHLLRREGFLFLNDVYSMLGFDKTQLGQITGWIVNSLEGDGYIDFDVFGAHNADLPISEPSIWLDFNVDGVIWDKIP
jgi:hypothetical protein